MTVGELIKELKKYPKNTDVLIWPDIFIEGNVVDSCSHAIHKIDYDGEDLFITTNKINVLIRDARCSI